MFTNKRSRLMAFSVFCRLLEYNLSRRLSIYEQMHFKSVVSSYCKNIFEYIVNILYNLSTQISIYEQMHFESVQCTYCMLFAPKVGLVHRLVHFTMQSFACNTLKNFAKQLSSTTCHQLCGFIRFIARSGVF